MSVEKIIQQALIKQPTGVEHTFKETIKPYINREVDVKRAEVGANLFTKNSDSAE